MKLYKDGKRYTLREDLLPSRKEAVVDMLNAIEEIRPTLGEMEKFIPMQFILKRTENTSFIDIHSFPYLRGILKKQIRKGYGFTEVAVSSRAIFFEAWTFLSRFNWVYTYDYDYKTVLMRQFDMPIPENNGEKQMLFVPEVFSGIQYVTMLSEEKYCQVSETCKTEEKL